MTLDWLNKFAISRLKQALKQEHSLTVCSSNDHRILLFLLFMFLKLIK